MALLLQARRKTDLRCQPSWMRRKGKLGSQVGPLLVSIECSMCLRHGFGIRLVHILAYVGH